MLLKLGCVKPLFGLWIYEDVEKNKTLQKIEFNLYE